MNILISTILFATCALLAHGDSSRGQRDISGPALSVSTVKDLHQRMLAQIKTVVFEERTVLLQGDLHDDGEELRTRLVDGYVVVYEQATNHPEVSARQIAAYDERLDQRLGSIDATSVVPRLNPAKIFDATPATYRNGTP